MEELDGLVIHAGGNHVERGSGKLEVGELIRVVGEKMEVVEGKYGKGIGVWSGLLLRLDIEPRGSWNTW